MLVCGFRDDLTGAFGMHPRFREVKKEISRWFKVDLLFAKFGDRENECSDVFRVNIVGSGITIIFGLSPKFGE